MRQTQSSRAAAKPLVGMAPPEWEFAALLFD
jgi:hypothetical protein